MRLRSWNAYESELTSGIDGSTNTITIISSVGLTAPVVLVIDPEDQGLREYVMVTTVAASTLTADRGLAGSAAGGQSHASGAKIRAVPVHQWLDEIFDDIDTVASDLADHEGAADPHIQYMLKSGSTMTGALVLSGDPTVALNPATKQYSDVIDDKVNVVTADLAAHEADLVIHHDKYTDPEAVAAMGPVSDSNELRHVRYTDSEAIDAINADTRYAASPIVDQSLTNGADIPQAITSLVLPSAGVWKITATGYIQSSVGAARPTFTLLVTEAGVEICKSLASASGDDSMVALACQAVVSASGSDPIILNGVRNDVTGTQLARDFIVIATKMA